MIWFHSIKYKTGTVPNY